MADRNKKKLMRDYLEPEVEVGQLYARIPVQKLEKFKAICKMEDISLYKGVEIAVDIIIERYGDKVK